MISFGCLLRKKNVLNKQKVIERDVTSMAINIGIDHGNKQIKISSGDIFPAGYKKYTERPLGNDILEFCGAYYTLTDSRIPFTWDKSQNDDFFILTLFALARYLESENLYYPDKIIDINIGVGLPPAHYSSLQQQFQKYFSQSRSGGDILEFVFHDRAYYVYVQHVFVFVQGYAAAVTAFATIKNKRRVAVIDIGGMTVDYILLRNGIPDNGSYGSLEKGIILLYNPLKEWIEGNYGMVVEDDDINDMLKGIDVLGKPEILTYVQQAAAKFTENIIAQLRELQMDLRVTPAVFVGGGAITLKPYLASLETVGQSFSVIDDVCANARGYDKLLRATIRQQFQAGDKG